MTKSKLKQNVDDIVKHLENPDKAKREIEYRDYDRRYKKQCKDLYTIELNGKQARVIQAAMELYSRLLGGQLSELKNLYMCRKNPKTKKMIDIDHNHLDSLIMQLKKVFFPELDHGASYGISCRDIHSLISWDLYQVIRHRLSWDMVGNPEHRDWKSMMTVNYDTPMHTSNEPLAKMVKIPRKKKVVPKLEIVRE